MSKITPYFPVASCVMAIIALPLALSAGTVGKAYHVKEQLLQNSPELNDLLPQLKELAEEGVKKDE
jgi:hypothetical protein